MEITYTTILEEILGNHLVNFEQEREAILMELREEVQFACHERNMSREQAQLVLEWAVTQL
jgi:hypothetical protein